MFPLQKFPIYTVYAKLYSVQMNANLPTGHPPWGYVYDKKQNDKCKELPQAATPPQSKTGPCAQLRELWACAITNS